VTDQPDSAAPTRYFYDQQLWEATGRPRLPEQVDGLHNALSDARHLRRQFDAVSAGLCDLANTPGEDQ
jgi:hypothetical protein